MIVFAGLIRKPLWPSPEGEAEAFSTVDELKLAAERAHELNVLEKEMGFIGKITGTTNISIKVAFVVEFGLFVLVACCIIWEAPNGVIDKLVTAMMTIIGFIFGVGASKSAGQ